MHPNPIYQKCQECGYFLPHHAHELCKACYERARRSPFRCFWVEENDFGYWVRCGRQQHKMGLCKEHYQYIKRQERNRRRREARLIKNPDVDIRNLERATAQSSDLSQLCRYWRALIRSGSYSKLRESMLLKAESISNNISYAFGRLLRSETGYLVHDTPGAEKRIPFVTEPRFLKLGFWSDEESEKRLPRGPPPPPSVYVLNKNYGVPDYISPFGDYGEVPYSEAAMHSRVAGLPIVRYALWRGGDQFDWLSNSLRRALVQVESKPGRVMPPHLRVVGAGMTVYEILSDGVFHEIGISRGSGMPIMPSPEDMGEPYAAVSANIIRRVFWPEDTLIEAATLQLFIYPISCQIYWRIIECFDDVNMTEFVRVLRTIPEIIEDEQA